MNRQVQTSVFAHRNPRSASSWGLSRQPLQFWKGETCTGKCLDGEVWANSGTCSGNISALMPGWQNGRKSEECWIHADNHPRCACSITLCQVMIQTVAAFFVCVRPNFNRYMSEPAAFLALNLRDPSLNVKGKVQPKLSRTTPCVFWNDKTNVSTFLRWKAPEGFLDAKQPS